MILKTWNIKGYHLSKRERVKSLIEHCDALVLTEVWTEDPEVDLDGHHIINCVTPQVHGGRGRNSGDVTIIVNSGVHYNKLLGVAEKEFQVSFVSIHSTPVVGVYIQPNSTVETIKRFQTELKHLARGSSMAIGDFNARYKNWDGTTTVQGRRLNPFCAKENFKVLLGEF